MSTEPEFCFRDFYTNHADLAGARSWMSNICGPHLLTASKPGAIQFRHSGNVLKSMSTTLGIIEFGTDVNVDVSDVDNFNCYSLSLPLSGEQEFRKGGILLRSDCDHGVIVSPNERQELSISGDCRKLQVVITRTAMRKTLEDLLQRPVVEQLCFDPSMDAVNGAIASWWRMARHFIEEMERSELYGQLQFSRDLESALVKGLILAQPSNYSQELRERLGLKLPHYLVKTKAFIHANAREELHLEDIEMAAGVSRCKLYEDFKKYFGMSPMAYLKKIRLTAVRQEILEDSSARNIAVIAIGWGFCHLSRFSSDYRKLFNENPRMTLQRLGTRQNNSL